MKSWWVWLPLKGVCQPMFCDFLCWAMDGVSEADWRMKYVPRFSLGHLLGGGSVYWALDTQRVAFWGGAVPSCISGVLFSFGSILYELYVPLLTTQNYTTHLNNSFVWCLDHSSHVFGCDCTFRCNNSSYYVFNVFHQEGDRYTLSISQMGKLRHGGWIMANKWLNYTF